MGILDRAMSAMGRLPERGASGGGAPQVIAPMDPRGIVPVNRVQPVATDGGEARRLMENRLAPASLPAESIVPAARPLPNYSVNSVAPSPPMSREAINAVQRTQQYGPPIPVQTGVTAPVAQRQGRNLNLPDGFAGWPRQQKLQWIMQNRPRAAAAMGILGQRRMA